MRRIAICTLVALLTLAVFSGTSLAAKGGNGRPSTAHNGNGGTIVLDQSDPHFGDRVTFTVSTSSTDKPWVFVRCYQNGVLVYDQRHGVYESYLFEPVFTLGPTAMWTGGGANCAADLVQWVNGDPRVLATTQFNVAP